MGVPHHHRDRFPSPELLHGIDVRARLHQSCGKGMAQIMKPKPFHICFLHDGIEHAQEIPPAADQTVSAPWVKNIAFQLVAKTAGHRMIHDVLCHHESSPLLIRYAECSEVALRRDS